MHPLDAMLKRGFLQGKKALNNLNSSKLEEFNAPQADRSPQTGSNLNNLKRQQPAKRRGGVPRLQLYTDPTLKRAMDWGVEEWLVQVCIRDYGEYTVKGQINRIYQIPDGYFKPQYGPIPGQRGRLFNREMQKLKHQKTIQPAD
jgi:hypothetical protein